MPEKVKDFVELFKATRKKIEGFEGCKGVQLLNDIKSTNIFFTYSHWDSEEHLENYRNSELFKDTWAKTKVLFNNKPEAWSVKEVESEKLKV